MVAETQTHGMTGRRPMAWYRFYILGAGKHIVAREEFEADNDESAINIAHQRYSARADLSSGFEVWCGDRLVFPEHGEGLASRIVA
jgi:hypothetical protein